MTEKCLTNTIYFKNSDEKYINSVRWQSIGKEFKSDGDSDAEYAGIINQPFLREIFSLVEIQKGCGAEGFYVASGPQTGKKPWRERPRGEIF